MNSRFEDFYVRFEDHFRGSRSDIKERQSVYLNCLNLLDRTDSPKEILDIGSGRGEWLELLRDNGWRAYGRDLNEAMVQKCRALGLEVECEDALGHLRSLPEGILTAVTGFHIVEHLPFEILLDLFTEVLRVLKPGGMVIFETPNPENLQVGAHTFYLDPTHIRPLAPSLLKFAAEQTGFHFADILRLHPYQELGLTATSNSPIEVHAGWLFFGPQDYAVLAVKAADDDSTTLYERMAEMISTLTQQAIKNPISMGEALRVFEEQARQAEAQAQQAESRAQQAEAQAELAEVRAEQAEIQTQNAEARVEQVEIQARHAEAQAEQAEVRAQQAEAQVQQAEAQVQQAEAQVQQAEGRVQQAEERTQRAEERTQDLLNSISWRVTGPFRAIVDLAIKTSESPSQKATSNRHLGNRLVRGAIEGIKKVPGTLPAAQYCERRWPGPWSKLMREVAPVSPKQRIEPLQPMQQYVPAAADDLTPRARKVYQDLKTAIEQRRKGNG